MKVSDFLRKYQIGGELPDDRGDTEVNFWAGWLMGVCRNKSTVINMNEAQDMAIKVAEFIENRARD